MPAQYARIPNPNSSHDPERELEAAFELNDDDEQDERPRDYDFPPPGSPPPPTQAIANDYGNSNGLVPTSPVAQPSAGPSFFRRAVGALLPTHYTRLATSDPSRPIGGGTENDGVFANVMAKPQAGKVVQTEDGNVYVVPEDSQKEMPPSYAEAQADAVPPYWETTIHAPASFEPGADMIIDDLPTGNFIIFAMNFIISWFFQFVGFFLTYMLHTSHAAKFGSRAGLGLTLIQFGFYSRIAQEEQADASNNRPYWNYPYVNSTTTEDGTTANPAPSSAQLSQTSKDWLSFLFMTLGWFLLLSSCVGFWRVKRWESSLRAPPVPEPTPQDIDRDRAIRHNLANALGIQLDDDERLQDPNMLTPAQHAALAAEARLTRDLRAAGLI
ncbi:hypothetical protein H1R20_g14263, partial [Candolleomyces eurysporus]